MKIQSWILAVALAALAIGVNAQEKPESATTPAVSPQQAAVQRAEALTQAQIEQSHDIKGLTRLGVLYDSQNDNQRVIWVLTRLSELLPNSGNLKLQLAMAYAKADDKTHAYDTLVRMQSQGFGYDIAKDSRFDPIHGTKVWDYIVANLAVNAKQFGEGKVAFELPKGDYLFDALAWDAKRSQLLAGSQREGNIYRVDAKGKLERFIATDAANGPWSVDAMGVDSKHGKLWVASASTTIYNGFSADNAGKSGLFEFDLASGKLVHKYTFPQDQSGHVLSALAVGNDGQVYVADSSHQQVFRIDNGALKPLLQNSKLTGISALALSSDGRTLYLADYALGIFGFDLTKSKAFELEYDPTHLVLGGIVGMDWYDGTLSVIEDGMVPKRVMRLKLTPDGRRVDAAVPLDVAQPAFISLGRGTVAGDKLYFVTNRQDALYDKRGVLTAADQLQPTLIFGSNLRFAWGRTGVAKGLDPEAKAKAMQSAKKAAETLQKKP